MPPPSSPVVVEDASSGLGLELDPATGEPRRLFAADVGWVPVSCRLSVDTGGEEARGPIGGLVYPGTIEVTLAGDGHGPVREDRDAGERSFSWTSKSTQPDHWAVTWRVRFRDQHPRIAIGVVVQALRDDVVARNVHLKVAARLEDPDAWRVQAPGNPLRPDLPLGNLTTPVAVSPAGGVDGSVGLVAFERPADPSTLVVWPLCADAIGAISLARADDGATISWRTDVAGQPGAGGELTVGALNLDLVAERFDDYLAGVPEQLASLGIASPADPPDWAVACNLYEVQIGYGVFAEGYRYAPYPTAAHLLADLDRIADLGYDTLQIMPRQPYPSYNVHDYADVTTSYGDEEVIRQIVDACHARGMRVILDILMHGVIDGEVVEETLAGIRSGPYADRLDEVIPDVTSLDHLDPAERDFYAIAWCAHVVDFGVHWTAGSPWRHPLADEHPEWFCRDSAGRITGMYTKAFDLAHPGWQRWFIDAALDLVRRLDIDGFRFDAPSYNEFHNWSERTRRDAASSMLGCLALFDDLRVELRDLKPDALLYTEPSGALYRMTMDMNYNYDEQWLVRAVMTHGAGRSHWVRDARELGRWLAHRDASLPRGSLTAHHLDSHDTFWWPHPGQKWRREQYGPEAAGALMTMYALSGGPYMTFVGGEVDIEDQVRAVNRLRATEPVFGSGVSDHRSVEVDADDVYAVLRRSDADDGLLLVNLSDRPIGVRCSIPGDLLASERDTVSTDDALGGQPVEWSRTEGRWTTERTIGPWQALATLLERRAEFQEMPA
jgi:hypothetical protein